MLADVPTDEDDTGGTGLAGDDDTTKPSAALPAEVTSATKSFAEAVTPKKKYDVLMNAWQCNYVCESDADCTDFIWENKCGVGEQGILDYGSCELQESMRYRAGKCKMHFLSRRALRGAGVV